jgi:hypothetical protein
MMGSLEWVQDSQTGAGGSVALHNSRAEDAGACQAPEIELNGQPGFSREETLDRTKGIPKGQLALFRLT